MWRIGGINEKRKWMKERKKSELKPTSCSCLLSIGLHVELDRSSMVLLAWAIPIMRLLLFLFNLVEHNPIIAAFPWILLISPCKRVQTMKDRDFKHKLRPSMKAQRYVIFICEPSVELTLSDLNPNTSWYWAHREIFLSVSIPNLRRNNP